MSVWNHGWFGCSSLTVDTYATVEKDTIQVHRGNQVMAVKSSSDIREISWVDGSMLLFLGKGSMLYGFSLDGNQGVVDVKDYERSEVHLNEGCVLLVKDKDADTVIHPKMENGNVSLEDAQRFPFPVKHEEDEKSGSVPLMPIVEGLKQEKEEENEKKVEVKKEKKEEETPDEDLDDNSVPTQERNTTGRTGANNRLLRVSHHKGGGRKEEVPRRIGPQLIQQRVVIKRRIRVGTEIVTRGKER